MSWPGFLLPGYGLILSKASAVVVPNGTPVGPRPSRHFHMQTDTQTHIQTYIHIHKQIHNIHTLSLFLLASGPSRLRCGSKQSLAASFSSLALSGSFPSSTFYSRLSHSPPRSSAKLVLLCFVPLLLSLHIYNTPPAQPITTLARSLVLSYFPAFLLSTSPTTITPSAEHTHI